MLNASDSRNDRVLIVGRSKKIVAESGLHRAMARMGYTVARFDDRKRRQLVGSKAANRWLRALVRAFQPKHVLFFKPHDVSVDTMAWIAERANAVMWYRDLTVPPDPELVARAARMDTVFLVAAGQANEWPNKTGAEALWLPNGADRDLDVPGKYDEKYACDVAFIGRGYDEYRAEFLCRLARKFKVRVWGQEWERWAKELNWDGTVVYEKDFGKVCASARIMIDIMPSFWEAAQVGVYASNRMVRMIAAGGFCLNRASPGLRDLYREGEHCIWYDTEEEAFAKIERYLQDDTARAYVRKTGHDFVWQHHMLDNRVPNLLTGAPYVNPLTAH